MHSWLFTFQVLDHKDQDVLKLTLAFEDSNSSIT